ncbi:MAG: Calx-beta domain-containing protein, partial [Steroidobacteraceae bacterium]
MYKLMLGSVALLATLAVSERTDPTLPGSGVEHQRGAYAAGQRTPSVPEPRAKADLSLPWVANSGQLPDGIAFYTPAAQAGTAITADGRIVYALDASGSVHVSERFVAEAARPRSGEIAPTRISSFVGNDPSRWVAGAPTYRTVGFGEVWPGIEVDLHARQGSVEKFFTVAPGASPADIQLELEGSTAVRVGEDGQLLVALSAGDVAFSAPEAFQEVGGERRPVPVAYATEGNRYGFRVQDYDRGLPLVIDPTLVYSTFTGGDGLEDPHDYHVDAAGALYVVGETTSLDLATTGAPYGVPADVAGNLRRRNGFLAKLAPDGASYEFFVYIGGLRNDSIEGIEVAADGTIYMGGHTDSADLPVTSGAAQAALNGTNRDFFVTKLHAAGTAIQYLTYLGGAGTEATNTSSSSLEGAYVKFGVDGSGRAYLYGMTRSSDYPVTAGAPQATFGGADDAVLTRVAADGTAFEFSTYLGGPGLEYTDRVGNLVVRNDGRVWVAGRVGTPGNVAGNVDFPVSAGAALTAATGPAVFVASYDTGSSTRRYATLVGGNNATGLSHMAVDAAGRAIVAGTTRASNLPGTAGAYDSALSGTNDGFVSILSDDGSAFVATTYFGGSGDDGVDRVLPLADGSMLLVGPTESSNLPVTPGAYSDDRASLFAARLNASLASLTWATYIGGNSDILGDARVDSAGTLYLLSDTSDNGLPTNDGLLASTTNNEDNEVWLGKLAADGAALVDAAYLSGSDDDEPLGLHVQDNGVVFIVGTTASVNFPVSVGAVDGTYSNRDFFMAKLQTRTAPLPPPAGSIAWTAATASVAEGAGTVTLSASRAGGSAGAASVQYTTTGGTATAGTDFTAASGSLNWADGESGSKSVTVSVANDTAVEAAESFAVTLATATGASLAAPSTATVTINDDDVAPPGVVAFSAAAFAATETQGSVTISVARAGGTAGAASVSYAASAGSATAGTDFTAASGVLNWADGEGGTKTFTVAVLDDAVDETSETVALTLSGAAVATLGSPAAATLTIADDDTPATRPV